MRQTISRLAGIVLAVTFLAVPAASAATPSNQLGGGTGAAFADECPSGTILAAINYAAGKDLDWVQGLCRPFQDGLVGSGYPGRLAARGAMDHGGVFDGPSQTGDVVQCPAGYAVQAIYVSVSRNNIVHSFYLECWRPSTGERAHTPMSSNRGGEGFPPRATGCGDGFYASGLAGGSGALIDRLGLLCEPIPVVAPPPGPAAPPPPPVTKSPPPPPKPPLPVTNDNGGGGKGHSLARDRVTDNGAPPNNGNGGGGSAATDTTIYDQPEGNDVAYLQSGDPVTIVSCNGNNWCRISSPVKGWVWGDDLSH